ncbi:had-superfamily hydrolase, subfamily iia, cecr5 [Trichoderma arundinaceum]|uniref:Had-superfamily hydrolase, subfamily iia, cecr5 n=1 Tax=Trichoderma arundinaceum TaxID=490622 RepID=A0A395NA45_TRIAR|nr:had-superfamily hydrolase, subfamily iia, cecr5 [Trichoderma arundinaceum]
MSRARVLSRCRLIPASRVSLVPQPSPAFNSLNVSASRASTGRRRFHAAASLFEKNRLSSHSSKKGPVSDDSRKALSEIAFAFDIDGVLYQGHRAIPGAREMLRKIRSHDIRYVFLTNGGGGHEDAKFKSLSKRLELSEDEDVIRNRIILSHTPMRGWDDKVKKQGTVLITGSHPEIARRVANESVYGFARAVTPADIIEANDKVYPFDNLRESLHKESRPLPDGKIVSNTIDPYSNDVPANALKIDQILVWNDPRDWSLDIQVIHDLLISHRGYLGTISDKNGNPSLPNNGWQQDGQPHLWISNLDLLWKTEYPVNRFGTGAFVEALKGVWAASTGGAELQFSALGKPSRHTYEYAHDRLLHHAPEAPHGKGQKRPLKRVYMIGDNPESDIRGANEFAPADGTEWISILVKTGVWKETAAQREPLYKPTVIVDDVVEAIAWAMRNEGVEATREWLAGSEDWV